MESHKRFMMNGATMEVSDYIIKEEKETCESSPLMGTTCKNGYPLQNQQASKEKIPKGRAILKHPVNKLPVYQLNAHRDSSNSFNAQKDVFQSNTNSFITAHDFVVRLGVLKCRHNNHRLEDIQAVITTISRQGTVTQISIPAGYCQNCDTYFIMDSVYRRIKHYGIPICRTMDEKAYKSLSNDPSVINSPYDRLAQESVLRQFGYSVNQIEDLPIEQRRRILSAIVDYDVLTKNEIISYLEYFINNRKNQKNRDGSLRYESAIEKWKEDRDWISGYRIGDFKKVAVGRIVTYK